MSCGTKVGLCDTFLRILSMACMSECTCEKECQCEDKTPRLCWRPCCVYIPCRNFHLCEGTTLQWSSQKRLCFPCSIQLGEHKYTRRYYECPICSDYAYMFQLTCKHILCNDCLYTQTKKTNLCMQCWIVDL